MIESIISSPVVGVDVLGDLSGASLVPEEVGALGAVSPNRLREFTAARTCAREALVKLGHPPAPILRGPRREPLWPAGVVGSITHCRGYSAAAVANAGDIAAVGVDAEPHAPLRGAVFERIASDDERALLAQLGPGDTHWDRVLFSAKESVFKAWFPLTHAWLGFEHAFVTIAPAPRTFRARLLVPGPEVDGRAVTEFRGRFVVEGDLLATSVVVPRYRRTQED